MTWACLACDAAGEGQGERHVAPGHPTITATTPEHAASIAARARTAAAADAERWGTK